MPKEVIKKEAPNGDTVFVQVGWSKEQCSVQIATGNESGILAKRDATSVPGYKFINDVTPGWFLDLSRSEINRLIKTLRIARDQAYGRDE